MVRYIKRKSFLYSGTIGAYTLLRVFINSYINYFQLIDFTVEKGYDIYNFIDNYFPKFINNNKLICAIKGKWYELSKMKMSDRYKLYEDGDKYAWVQEIDLIGVDTGEMAIVTAKSSGGPNGIGIAEAGTAVAGISWTALLTTVLTAITAMAVSWGLNKISQALFSDNVAPVSDLDGNYDFNFSVMDTAEITLEKGKSKTLSFSGVEGEIIFISNDDPSTVNYDPINNTVTALETGNATLTFMDGATNITDTLIVNVINGTGGSPEPVESSISPLLISGLVIGGIIMIIKGSK